MDRLPRRDEQEWLLASLGDLFERTGAGPFVDAPIVEPTNQFFPDRWEPSEAGVTRLAQRLLDHAGLASLDAHVTLYTNPTHTESGASPFGWRSSTHREGAAAWFAGIDGKTCLFGADTHQLQSPEGIVGAMAHEVSHAWRNHRGLEVDGPEEELLTDLTTIHLGFGIVTVNASYRFRKSGQQEGMMSVTEWQHARLGYLSPQAMSFLLGVQARARKLDSRQRRRIAGFLEANQSAYFHAACKAVGDPEIARLSLSAPGGQSLPAAGKSPRYPYPEPELDAREDEPEPASDSEQDLPAEIAAPPSEFVFRVEGGTPRAMGFLTGALLGMLPGAAISFVLDGRGILWTLFLPILLGGIALAAFQKKRPDFCSDSDCSRSLPEDEIELCPGCRRPLVGTIASRLDRLDAEERVLLARARPD